MIRLLILMIVASWTLPAFADRLLTPGEIITRDFNAPSHAYVRTYRDEKIDAPKESPRSILEDQRKKNDDSWTDFNREQEAKQNKWDLEREREEHDRDMRRVNSELDDLRQERKQDGILTQMLKGLDKPKPAYADEDTEQDEP